MSEKKDALYSYYRIRQIIGILGLCLPILVIFGFGDFASSLSHYYYTKSSLFFTAILTAFGLLLISYKGYKRDLESETVSDNIVTNFGGLMVLFVVLIPTSCSESYHPIIDAICESKIYPLYGHDSKGWNTVHLVSAGLFLIAMGWMSIYKFTRSKKRKTENMIYKTCGYIVWVCVGILGLEFLFGFEFTKYDVLILECVAVGAFGISWLIKGKTLKDLNELRKRIFGQQQSLEEEESPA